LLQQGALRPLNVNELASNTTSLTLGSNQQHQPTVAEVVTDESTISTDILFKDSRSHVGESRGAPGSHDEIDNVPASLVDYGGVSGFSESDGGLEDNESDVAKEVVVGGAGASFEGETGTDESGISTDVRVEGSTSHVVESRGAPGAQDEIDNDSQSSRVWRCKWFFRN
jgi:hypothetical protein